jgi:DNA-binding response OmpR family regulator
MTDQTSKKKILIIEDDTSLLMIYKTKFESEGFEVFEATSGHQGLSLASEHKPDMILLDIMLPEGMNGFDVMQQMKLIQGIENIPVILLTNLESEKNSGLAAGAKDYVVKANTSIDELVVKIKTHLGV